jgi:hypothetical protein
MVIRDSKGKRRKATDRRSPRGVAEPNPPKSAPAKVRTPPAQKKAK